MRELDLNNKNKIVARNSVFNHFNDLSDELNKYPSDKLLLRRIKITSKIIQNLEVILNDKG